MAVLLPLEIWSQIASYIPDEELQKLITINHAFYEVGLNSRYRKLAVRYFNNETISKLQSLGDVTVARRVQDLELDTVAFDSLESAKNSRWKKLAAEFFRVMIARRRRAYDLTSIPAKKTYELLFEAVKFMHNVHSLYFRVHPRGKSAREFLPMLTRLWLLLSRRVRTLTVHVPVDQTHIAFPIFTEVSLVQHLSIIVTTRALRWSGSWTVDSAIDVANFVNTMSENLTSLSLNLGTGASSELRFLLNNLLPCDRMTSIDLHLPYDVVLGQDVAQLLRQHARLLTDFTFTPSIASNVATSPLSLITTILAWEPRISFPHIP
ncbi:hypothetical protein ONZ45_g19532 [Pleurotus djamor]|nr:hypothetical protein ONZ45_g19532 [Pleurotus djamor]